MVHGLDTLAKLNEQEETKKPKPGSAGELSDRLESTLFDLREKIDNGGKVTREEILDTVEDVITNFF